MSAVYDDFKWFDRIVEIIKGVWRRMNLLARIYLLIANIKYGRRTKILIGCRTGETWSNFEDKLILIAEHITLDQELANIIRRQVGSVRQRRYILKWNERNK